jgi:hypothetical protein
MLPILERVITHSCRPNPPEESIALFMERNPAAYAKIVEFLEAGHSPAGAAALTRTPLATVRKIRNLLGEVAIAAGIRATARNLTEASQLMSERLIDEFDQIPISTLPNALGVIVDRTSLLVGQPTVRIEHRSVPSPEDLKAMFDALPKANAVDVSIEKPHDHSPLPLKSKHTP